VWGNILRCSNLQSHLRPSETKKKRKNPCDVLEIQTLFQSGFQAFKPGERRKTELKKKVADQKVLEEPHDFRGLTHSDCELGIY